MDAESERSANVVIVVAFIASGPARKISSHNSSLLEMADAFESGLIMFATWAMGHVLDQEAGLFDGGPEKTPPLQ